MSQWNPFPLNHFNVFYVCFLWFSNTFTKWMERFCENFSQRAQGCAELWGVMLRARQSILFASCQYWLQFVIPLLLTSFAFVCSSDSSQSLFTLSSDTSVSLILRSVLKYWTFFTLSLLFNARTHHFLSLLFHENRCQNRNES